MSKRPYWKCICGSMKKHLTDKTKCKCKDVYEEDWFFIKTKTDLKKYKEEKEKHEKTYNKEEVKK